MNDDKPKIVQILMAPNNSTWQGALFGLGSDGIVYVQNIRNEKDELTGLQRGQTFWEPAMPALGEVMWV